uniref:T-cell surface antigen CD2-like n=1 Tax=Paramormyrops kingsleyae TaxID=1676925 RepID=A0A3B3S6V2_9TELE
MKTCLICANILYNVFATHAGREVKEVFGRVKGEVTLTPKVNQPISSITWKSGLNKAAEWETGQSTPDYYTICKPGPRCQLDHTTGELKIMHLKPIEKLYFTAEINGMAAQSFFTLIALEPVSKPSVRKTCKNTQCTLECEGTDTTYTKYSWKENNEMIADDTTTLHVQKSDKLDKIYTCVFSNPVSTEESDPVKEVELFPVMEVKEVFGRAGGKVTLVPKVDQPITSITWKNGPNITAKWDSVNGIVFYAICKVGQRCQLDSKTGGLQINSLKLTETLNFTAAINGNAPISCFPVVILDPVSKPSVTSACNDTQCTLFCKGLDTAYTKYSWKENNEMIADDTTTLHVEKSDKLDKIYTCVFSNPVSTAESDPVKELDLFPGGSSGGLIAGVIALCVAAVGCGIGIGLYYKKKGKIINLY